MYSILFILYYILYSDFESIRGQQFHYKKAHMPLVFTTLKLKKETFEDSIIWEGLSENEDIRKHSG